MEPEYGGRAGLSIQGLPPATPLAAATPPRLRQIERDDVIGAEAVLAAVEEQH